MRQLLLIALSFSLILASAAAGQAQDTDTTNADLLYAQSRQAAFEEEDYPKAIALAWRALEAAPDYTEVREFLGRLYFWDGQMEKAEEILLQVIEESPELINARITLVDVMLETGNYSDALRLSEEGLRHHSSNPELIFRKGRSLEGLGKDDEAIRQYRQVLSIDPGYPFVHDLIEGLNVSRLNWQARTIYTFDSFNKTFDPWHLGTFELQRNTSAGDLQGRIQYGSRFSTDDYQLELDGYPRLSRKMYAYVNTGISGSAFFPDYRLGATLYRTIPGNFEAGIGLRYLHFNDPNIFVYTVSLSHYLKNYWLSGRAYYSPDLEGRSLSFNLIARRFLSNPNNFIELVLGAGSATTGLNSQQDINRLGSLEAGIGLEKELSSLFAIRAGIKYQREEYSPDTYRNHWQGRIGIIYRF